ITGHVASRDVHAAGEPGYVGVETGQLGQRLTAQTNHPNPGQAGLAGAGDVLVDTVAVQIACGDMNPAGERGVVCVEVHQFRERPVAVEMQHADVRTAARACAGDDLIDTVAVHIAGRHVDAAGESGDVCGETRELRQRSVAAEMQYADVRSAARSDA